MEVIAKAYRVVFFWGGEGDESVLKLIVVIVA